MRTRRRRKNTRGVERRYTARQREDLVRDLCRPVSPFDATAARAYRHAVGLACAVAVLVVVYGVGAGVGFWAHARTSGRFVEPQLQAAVSIRRDARDVPHIVAASQTDLFFAQGFVEASDRLFQMELTRRYALGTLAEVLGPRALAIDQQQRYFDVRDIATRQWRGLAVRDRAALTAFSAGVNAAMRQQPTPVEFRLLLYRPRPWTPQDSLAVSLAVSIALADSWHDVLARDDTWRRFGSRAFERYFPLSDPRYDVTADGRRQAVPAGGRVSASVALGGVLPGRRGVGVGVGRRAGSNAWAVGGRRTVGGRALLANDPHVDLTIPGLWYLEDLRAPGIHAAGASIPGAPGILLGHNERIAWGATNAGASAMSLFAASGRVSRRSWVREVFRVRFGKDVVRSYYRTADAFGVPNPYDRGRLVLVRWPAYAARTSSVAAFLALDRARSLREATAILSSYRGTAENFVLADTHGNVAYHLAGSVPRDPAWGRYVHRGADARRSFGTVAFAQLPEMTASRDAEIVSANNKMYGDGYRYRLSATFEPPYRAFRIAQLLHARRRYDAAYFARMQLDAVSPVDAEFARDMVAAAKGVRDEPAFHGVTRELASWNGDFSRTSRGATVEHALRVQLEGNAASLYALLTRLRSGRDSDDADLRGALYSASGPPQPWGRAGAIRVEHPLAPLRFGFLNGAALPGDGDEYTIHLQEPGFAQSFRAVWDAGNWDAGGIVIPSGESGEPGSGHYDDLRAAWVSGRLVPLPFSDRSVAAATRVRLLLEPTAHF